jgi:hypothetical protein
LQNGSNRLSMKALDGFFQIGVKASRAIIVRRSRHDTSHADCRTNPAIQRFWLVTSILPIGAVQV